MNLFVDMWSKQNLFWSFR